MTKYEIAWGVGVGTGLCVTKGDFVWVTNLCENVPKTCIQPPGPHAVRFQPFLNDVTSLSVRLVLVRVLEK